MSSQRLRDVTRAMVPRTGAQPAASYELATVTGLDPLTVELADGTVLTSPPRLRSAVLGIDDVAVVRRVGTSRLVLDAIDPNGVPLVSLAHPGQTFATGGTAAVSFAGATVEVDSHSWVDVGNSRVVPTIPGWYRVNFWGQTTDATVDGTRIIATVRVGSVTGDLGWDYTQGATKGFPNWGASGLVQLNGEPAGYVDATIFHDRGADVGMAWHLQLELVRPTE